MKKKKYSLTAKERKEERAKMQSKIQGKDSSEVGVDGVAVKKPIKMVWIICAVVMGVIMIAVAIILPIVLYKPYDTDNPVARFTLSNGMIIDMEIFEDEAPIASTNFMFLVQNKFFDNTIIFDNSNKFVRFGGYTSNKKHKETDASYCATVKGIPKEYADNKFGYKINSDQNIIGQDNDEGIVSFIQMTSTEFQICAVSGAQKNMQSQTGSSQYTMNGSPFGKIMADDLAEIKLLTDTAKHEDGTDGAYKQEVYNPSTSHGVWRAPLQTVRIESVKLLQYNKKRWENIDLMKKLKDCNGFSAWTSGSNGGSLKD